jgi:hypothetical protein
MCPIVVTIEDGRTVAVHGDRDARACGSRGRGVVGRLSGFFVSYPTAGSTSVHGGGCACAGSSAFRMYWPVIGLEMIER